MIRSQIADHVWSTKYKGPSDNNINDTYQRVAEALAIPEAKATIRIKEFFDVMLHGRFIPAGRIMAGAGLNTRKVTLLNCYVSGTINDSMEGIFEALKQAAITQKYGGGIGFDFSTLRPAGAEVIGAASPASGPISFMHVFDSMCKTIMSAGERRGAMMAILRIDHPDIIEFIKCKGKIDLIDSVTDTKLKTNLYQKFGSLRNFNISVAITDKFMSAVEHDEDWNLIFNFEIYKTIRARDLWKLIMQHTYDNSEPGVVFIDRINEQHNLNYMEKIAATNPCGEQPLAPNDSCNLGAINLASFVKNPFTKDAEIDIELLKSTVNTAVRMLDNVRDITKYPNERQQKVGNATRRIGLGIMGLGTSLQLLNIRYNSPNAFAIAEQLMNSIANQAYFASANLAIERGPFPAYNREKINTHLISRLRNDVQDHIYANGLRNGTVLTVAPTGTIALAFGDNCTSGIEPAFLINYTRNVRKANTEEYNEFDVKDYGARLYETMFPNTELPECIIDSVSSKIKPIDHINMQAVIQRWVDASISKTINMPVEASYEEMENIYLEAYRLDCKGCTTYRPSNVRGSILTETKTNKPIQKTITTKYQREPVLNSKTYYIPQWPADGSTRYVTISNRDDKPWEIFIQTKSTAAMAETMAIARILSALFKRAENPMFLADALKEIYSMDGSWINGVFVSSLPAAYGMVLEAHLTNTIPIFSQKRQINPTKQINNEVAIEYKICPVCSQPTLISIDGCKQCTSCGYSSCS